MPHSYFLYCKVAFFFYAEASQLQEGHSLTPDEGVSQAVLFAELGAQNLNVTG